MSTLVMRPCAVVLAIISVGWWSCAEEPGTSSGTGSADAMVETLGGGDASQPSDTSTPPQADAVSDGASGDTSSAPEVSVSSDFGQPCDDNSDCLSGWCVPSQEGNICSDLCQEPSDCPNGFSCKPTISAANATVYLCLPPILNHCGLCAESYQCDSGACVSLDGEGRCVFPCTSDEECPTAFVCGEVPGAQVPGTHCLPATNSCTCNAYIQGGIRTCLETNDVGTCYGAQICKTSAGWTECSAETPVIETCDGADNDCNGLIDDEIVVGEPCENTVEGVGSCVGFTVCAGTNGMVCQAPVPTVEVCDGQDNDCDGTVDEDFRDADGNWTLVTHCGYCGNECSDKIVNGTGTCGGTPEAPVCVVDTCNPGFVQVNAFQCLPPIDVTCAACVVDGDCLGGTCISFDNQDVCMSPCDAFDGGCPTATTCTSVDGVDLCVPDSGSCSCTAASDGKTRPCLNTNSAGTCQGLETCDPAQGWTGCTAPTAAEEICDGIDNDCDGVIDDGVGVTTCTNSVVGVGACDGPNICQGQLGWVCQAQTPQVEACDYLDNDCDGLVDEDFTDANGAFTTDQHCGSCGLDCTDKVANGTGQCGGTPEAPSCQVATCDPGYYQAGPLVCLPVTEDLCTPCVSDGSCPTPGDACLQLDGGGFCGRDCSAGNLHGTPEGECPTGFTCVTQGSGAKQCQPVSDSCSCLPADAGNVRPCSFTTATGACLGQETCDPNAGWVGCTAVAEPETCNLEDDDCDGEVDEGFDDLYTACSVGTGACEAFGLVVCSADGSATTCSATEGDPTDDICDGLDNDCDNQTDEDFTDLFAPCSVGQGICRRFGYQACTEDGSATACNAVEAQAEQEVCDGLDNNCDGETDEGFSNLGQLCEVGFEACKNTGIYQCNALGTGTQCSASAGTGDAEVCDNLDNDCDGLTDEDFATLNSVCVVGEGICANAGTWICNAEGSDVACSATPLLGSDETCNGVDDNCNGIIDDGIEASAPSCAKTEGVCAGATQTCGGLSGWLACAGPEYGTDYEPVEITCDGKDNDCDGSADNGLQAPLCPLQKGVCAGSLQICGGAGGWATCGAAQYGADYEVDEATCDGLDNDCDGLVDEGFSQLGQVCLAGQGACQVAGTYICSANGNGTECSATPGPESPEVCNGIDDDCDNQVDEDFADLGKVCTDGEGACTDSGTWICSADGQGLTCTATPGTGGAEDCNGIDDDCNGQVDDGLPAGPLCSTQGGVCSGSRQSCGGLSGWIPCTFSEFGPDYEPTELSCDGLDNDCDGVTDGNLPGAGPCQLQTGVCTGSTTTCANGAWQTCSAAEYGPDYEVSETTCDYQDNDCNGITDDPFVDNNGEYNGDTACGNCFTDCVAIFEPAPNAYGRCDTSSGSATCTMLCCDDADPDPSCDQTNNWFDLNGVISDGCEFPLDPDVIYVSVNDPGASDSGPCGLAPSATGLGYPCASIGVGLTRASSTGRSQIHVAAGVYNEDVTLVNGKSLMGGYNPVNWSREPAGNVTVINGIGATGNVVTVTASGIDQPTVLDGFVINGVSAVGIQANSYAVYISGSTNALRVSNNVIYASDGGPGRVGSPGVDGVNGTNGSTGSNGGQVGTNQLGGACATTRSGGSGGQRVCGSTEVHGGAGGDAVCRPKQGQTQSAQQGQKGFNGGGNGGTGGQDGGTSSSPYNCNACYVPNNSMVGNVGANGGDGSNGGGGAGCSSSQGGVLNGNWTGNPGATGGLGAHGGGGGGGGAGGGGEDMDLMGCKDDLGGTGGGGGSGACGGNGGTGGTAGGGSFGIFVVQCSAAPDLRDNVIYRGFGGRGGDGGNGGGGGIGGDGAVGGAECTNTNCFCTGDGGKGGQGGNGGHGGGGGGGCGGVSYGIYAFDYGGGNPSYNTLNDFPSSGGGGFGGAGGASIGNNGNKGNNGATSGAFF